MKRTFAAIVCFIALTGVARAQPPVALVEEVQGKVTGADFMDYVVPGQVIKLGSGGMVVISYLKSCWHETISGVGTVIVVEGSDSRWDALMRSATGSTGVHTGGVVLYPVLR